MSNLANGTNHQDVIISHPHILSSLRSCMSDAAVQVRRPAVTCVRELIRANPQRRQEFQDAGITSTLRHMCDRSGAASLSPGGRTVAEDEKQVIVIAREAVDWLDHGGDVPTG